MKFGSVERLIPTTFILLFNKKFTKLFPEKEFDPSTRAFLIFTYLKWSFKPFSRNIM